MLRRLAHVGRGACGAWHMCGAWRLQRLAPASLGTSDAWHLRGLALGARRHCLFGLASRGPNEPKSLFWDVPKGDIIVIDHFCLLGLLDASNLLQYAIHNFYSDYCLFGLASRGLWRSPEAKTSPNACFRDVPRVIISRFITFGPVSALPQHRWRCPAHSGPSLTS